MTTSPRSFRARCQLCQSGGRGPLCGVDYASSPTNLVPIRLGANGHSLNCAENIAALEKINHFIERFEFGILGFVAFLVGRRGVNSISESVDVPLRLEPVLFLKMSKNTLKMIE